MKMITKAATILSAAVITMAGCGTSEESSGGSGLGLLAIMASGSGTVADMSQASLDTVNDSLADINLSGETTTLSYHVPFPGTWQANPTLQERLLMAEGTMMDRLSAKAAPLTTSCPGGGSVVVTDPADTWNSTDTAFYVTRTFNDCTGPFGFFKVSGDVLLYWSGMNAATGVAKLQNGSQVRQAPINKRFTRVATGGYVTVEGNGATITNGTLSGAVAHTVAWSSVSGDTRSFTIDTDLTRKGYNGLGTLLYEHHITTPSPLNVTANTTAQTRTVSGTVQVEHVISGAIVSTTFTNLVIPMGNCSPSSGTATIAITGYWTGNGTITYSGDGTADYTYSYENARGRTFSGEGTFAVSGCQ
ncbi:MAG TPA: hypothetical protein PLM53_14465 [Spirochaetota bacterium]|nr:hypothetical protein [Spirochaetota bacterium]HPC41921.1 hypothetical protein [Spirochaetota bacterium]HPL17351.1 hypothetical protein [Spirochaetota bacterium]HQF09631.1 hypothetical protein [Spirochaetota bacterium]HQH98299.1 hypothetical protein [Spirochaetota bacterium]